jgi:arylsulfatase A-like enzyme
MDTMMPDTRAWFRWMLVMAALTAVTAWAGAAEPVTMPAGVETPPLPSQTAEQESGTVPEERPRVGLPRERKLDPRAFTRPAASSAPASRPATKPAVPTGPNVILVIVSDQAAGMTGFEGHPQIKTPSLDRFAAEGVYMERCYTPTPMSVPSRASILTGQYPHTHGATGEKATLSPESDTFTARLKTAGYTCGIVGKWNLPATAAKTPGFGLTDYIATEDADAEDRGWKWDQCPVWVRGEKKTADKFLTDWETDRAIEYVEKNKDRPFFLWLAFRTNQEPLTSPPGMETRYPPDSIKLPDQKTKVRSDQPPTTNNSKAATDVAGRDDRKLHEARSKYYAMISRMDENFGRLTARLDELNLREKTVVIFTSDGGTALGEHGLYGRGPFIYDTMIRCPLVVRYPAMIQKAGRRSLTVSLTDLAPTICELVGLPRGPMMQGYSLVPLLRSPSPRGLPDERFLEYDAQPVLFRGVVTSQYKFARYLHDGNFDVLFHLAHDADELNNVAKQSDTMRQYAGVVKIFQNRVEQWRKTTRDMGR